MEAPGGITGCVCVCAWHRVWLAVCLCVCAGVVLPGCDTLVMCVLRCCIQYTQRIIRPLGCDCARYSVPQPPPLRYLAPCLCVCIPPPSLARLPAQSEAAAAPGLFSLWSSNSLIPSSWSDVFGNLAGTSSSASSGSS